MGVIPYPLYRKRVTIQKGASPRERLGDATIFTWPVIKTLEWVVCNIWLERLHSGEFGGRLGITKTFPDAIELEFLASTKENSGPMHVHLLEVGSRVGSGKRGPVGLILREASRSQESNYRTFNRLGMFHIDKKAIKQQPLELNTEEWDRRVQSELCWFDGCDLEIVVIVWRMACRLFHTVAAGMRSSSGLKSLHSMMMMMMMMMMFFTSGWTILSRAIDMLLVGTYVKEGDNNKKGGKTGVYILV